MRQVTIQESCPYRTKQMFRLYKEPSWLIAGRVRVRQNRVQKGRAAVNLHCAKPPHWPAGCGVEALTDGCKKQLSALETPSLPPLLHFDVVEYRRESMYGLREPLYSDPCGGRLRYQLAIDVVQYAQGFELQLGRVAGRSACEQAWELADVSCSSAAWVEGSLANRPHFLSQQTYFSVPEELRLTRHNGVPRCSTPPVRSLPIHPRDISSLRSPARKVPWAEARSSYQMDRNVL